MEFPIANFAGYQTEEQRGLADEQIRAFIGERLAELPAVEIDSLSPDERALYDRVLLRCEFANQLALARFAHVKPSAQSIERTMAADKELLDAALELDSKTGAGLHDALRDLDQAFDKRDGAMQGQ